MLFVELGQRLEQGANAAQLNTAKDTVIPLVPRESTAGSNSSSDAPQVSGTAVDSNDLTAETGQSSNDVQSQSTSVPARDAKRSLSKDDFQVLVPAFVTSQLKEAFEVGFLIFIPFVIIDMVIANILLAMGMSMLSPSVISLPFKLLLFVLVDGWFLIIRGLVLSYA